MPRKGREREKLVAKIEQVLNGTDVEIKSPDYIVGINSKELREIDVSLRARMGSTSLLVILEVRDRGKKEGVSWIEQLAEKREDVQASKVVAVSTSGFSKAAQNTAAHLGIELRVVEELTIESVAHWFPFSSIEAFFRSGVVQKLFLGIGASADQVTKDFLLRSIKNDEKLLIRDNSQKSIKELWQEVVNHCPSLFEGIEPGGKSARLWIELSYPSDRCFRIITDRGSVNVLQIKFLSEMSIRKMNLKEIIGYSSSTEEEPLAVRFAFKLDQIDVGFAFHRVENDPDALIVTRCDPDETDSN